MSNNTAERFVNDLMETLNGENERRVSGDKSLLNVAFLVASVQQHIGESQFEDFICFLDAGDYSVHYYRSPDEDSYYTLATARVNSSVTQEFYEFTFGHDDRLWGYCMCEPTTEGYNAKHRCCGNGCDWSAPAFILEKRHTIGKSSWNGNERDYWVYADAINAKLAILNVDLHNAEKSRKAGYLRDEISRLQEQLAEVE